MDTERIETVKVDLEWYNFLSLRLEDIDGNLVLGPIETSTSRIIGGGNFYDYPIIFRQMEKKPWPKWLVGFLGRLGIDLRPRNKVVAEETVAMFAAVTTLTVEKPFVDMVVFNEDFLAPFRELLEDYERIFAEDTRNLKVRLTLHTTQIRKRKGKPKENSDEVTSEAELLAGPDHDVIDQFKQAE